MAYLDYNGLQRFKTNLDAQTNGLIASVYDSTKTYDVGDYVIYNNDLYRCITAITTAEAWTAAHWVTVALADDVENINGNLWQAQTRYIACESGSFQDANGAVKTANIKRLRNIRPVSITDYESITIPDGYGAWIFRLDKNGNHISAVGSWLTGTVDLTVSTRFSSAVKYINFAIRKTSDPNADISAYASTVSDGLILNPKQGFMFDESFTLSILGPDALFTLNGLINLYGAWGSNNSYKTTEYIRVTKGQSVKYNLRGTSTITILAFYTDRREDTFVSAESVVGNGVYKSGIFTAPSNGYIRACCENYNFNNAYLYTEAYPNVRNFGAKPIEKNLNVLLMGDSIFGSDGEIASFLDELCGSCTNGAFGGTQVKVRSAASDNFKYFDGVNIITALCNQAWTDQDAAASALESTYPWVPTRLATLKAVDMSNVDLLIMDWGTNDYTASETIDDITTAYGTVIDLLQETYPELRILITTPIWRYWGDPEDNENGDTKVYNVSTLKEIALAIEAFMKDKRISVLNAYQNLPLSYNTAETYFDSGDKTHLNTFGNKVYAQLLHGKIRSIY